MRNAFGLIGLVVFVTTGSVEWQPAQDPGRGQLLDIVVHGASIEKNLLGISADRAVSVYLPPSYPRSSRRYPVVYILHGIMDSNRTWTQAWDTNHLGYATIQDLMDHGIRAGILQEMVVVVPDADKSCHYTDSPVKGGWGSFIAKDLVDYVDRTYRTIASPQARGLMGHSMGGHGAIKIAMTHPGVFSVIDALNPSLLGWGGDVSLDNPALGEVEGLQAPRDLAQANFYTQTVVGVGQCFSPEPSAPLLTGLPFTTGANGRLQEGPAYARWTSQMPVYMVPTHVPALKALRGLRFDSAFEDEFSHIPVTSRALAAALDAAGVDHIFEMYNGDHRNRLWGPDGRIYAVALPYFSRLLAEGGAAISTGAEVTNLPPVLQTSPTNAKAQVALWDAAIAGDLKAAAAALKAGADVNALDTRSNVNGRRPLNHAAENNRADMIRWLAANGADVNRANASGYTPLHHAAESGSLAAAEALLALGANPKATLPSGSTPLDVARQRGKTAIVQLLEKIRGSFRSPA